MDSRTKLIHAVAAMPANVADSTVLPERCTGKRPVQDARAGVILCPDDILKGGGCRAREDPEALKSQPDPLHLVLR
jgi:hypothetical protein